MEQWNRRGGWIISLTVKWNKRIQDKHPSGTFGTLHSSKNNIRQNDPFFNIKGFDSDAPSDLASNHDLYLYGK